MLNIQNKVYLRIFKGTAAAGFEQVLNVIIQLVSVPLYIKYWGLSLYGEWILLFSIPSYLAISDLGFTKAAVNSMTLSCADSNYVNANRYYHSCFTLLILLGAIVIGGVIISLYYIPALTDKLNVVVLSFSEVKYIIISLSIYILLFQQAELLRGIVSASGKFYYSMGLVGVYRFLEFSFSAFLILMGYGPKHIALIYVGIQILMIIHLVVFIKINFEWPALGLRSSFTYTSSRALKQMLKPAIAFMLLPVGYAIRNQVPILIIGALFDPATIVVYTTARIVTNSGNQIINSINKAITPEYALAYGGGDLHLVRLIHHNSCNIALGIAVVLAVLLLGIGEPFIKIWTHHAFSFDWVLFTFFLISVVFSSLWSTSSYLSYSINKHTDQSLLFILSCVVSSIFTYIFLKFAGFSYAACGIVIADLMMIVFVFIKNMKLLDEEAWSFIKNVIKFPSVNNLKLFQKVKA